MVSECRDEEGKKSISARIVVAKFRIVLESFDETGHDLADQGVHQVVPWIRYYVFLIHNCSVLPES